MPTGSMPNDIRAAAALACATMRVGVSSSVVVSPEPSV
jgi:hypothetical protein